VKLDARSLRAMVPALPRSAWRILTADLFSSLGTGLTMPFLMIYLTEVRHFSLTFAGLVLALESAVGILLAAPVGTLIDRVGAGRVFTLALAVTGVATAGLGFATQPWHAVVAVVALGVANPGMWAGFPALISEVVPEDKLGTVFGLSYQVMNVGIGLGGVLGGVIIGVASPESLGLLFVLDGATFLVFTAVLLIGGEGRRGAARTASSTVDSQSTGLRFGYRAVLKDRALLWATGINSILALAAFSQITSAFPAWAVGPGGAPAAAVGYAFAANTIVVIIAQPVVLRLSRGRRRTSVTAVGAVFFSLSWVIVVLAGAAGSATAAAICVILGLAVFALGEVALSPSLPVVVNSIATDELRGRYNTVFQLSRQIGGIGGPAVAGVAIAGQFATAYLLILAGACLVAAIATKHLRTLLSDKHDGLDETPERRDSDVKAPTAG
jgi:MFS family permease